MAGVRLNNQGNPGMIVFTYGYDGLHRRIRRSTLSVPTRYYHNESWQVVEEEPGDGSSRVQYVWDVRYIDAAVLRDRDGDGDGDCVDGDDERVYCCQDANFNVTSLVDGYDGATVERYAYDPYGKPTFLNGVRDANGYSTTEWQARTLNTFENELLYCGYRWDGGRAGHYHVRYRVYHPSLGRWMQRDPIGYGDGANVYGYLGGWPTAAHDPTGLQGEGAGEPVKPSCCCTDEPEKCHIKYRDPTHEWPSDVSLRSQHSPTFYVIINSDLRAIMYAATFAIEVYLVHDDGKDVTGCHLHQAVVQTLNIGYGAGRAEFPDDYGSAKPSSVYHGWWYMDSPGVGPVVVDRSEKPGQHDFLWTHTANVTVEEAPTVTSTWRAWYRVIHARPPEASQWVAMIYGDGWEGHLYSGYAEPARGVPARPYP